MGSLWNVSQAQQIFIFNLRERSLFLACGRAFLLSSGAQTSFAAFAVQLLWGICPADARFFCEFAALPPDEPVPPISTDRHLMSKGQLPAN